MSRYTTSRHAALRPSMPRPARTIAILGCLLAVVWAAQPALAQPTQMSYQGHLVRDGVPYTGLAEFKLALITPLQDSIWSNDGTSIGGSEPSAAFAIAVEQGIFSILVGSTALGMMPLMADNLVAAPEALLRVWVNTGAGFERLSDVPLASSAYALRADTAQRSIGPFSVWGELITYGGVRFGDGTLQVTAATGTGPDSDWIITGSDMYSGVSGKIGIGTTTPNWPLHLTNDQWAPPDYVDSITLVAERHGTDNPNCAIQAYVVGDHSIALAANAVTSGAACWFSNDGNIYGIGIPTAVLADCNKPNGYAVWGHTSQQTGVGVYGENGAYTGGTAVRGNSLASTGESYGGWFQTASTEGYGLYAETASTNVSVYAPAGVEAHGGTAIRGESPENGNALVGVATGAVGYGVYGECSGGGYAARLNGRVEVLGDFTVSGGTKSFLIDHPLDPANKVLAHACVESDQRLNVYRGNVVLDGSGKARVALPDWFEAINTDFTYALTAVGAPAPQLHVAREIAGSDFEIAGGPAGLKVSWTVTAVRNDEWARQNPMVVERDKADFERGYYLTPEAFMMSADRGILRAKDNVKAAAPRQPAVERAFTTSPQEAAAGNWQRRAVK